MAHAEALFGEVRSHGMEVAQGRVETLRVVRGLDWLSDPEIDTIRMANLYANLVQLDCPAQLEECFNILTERSAKLLNLKDYGLKVGNPGDMVIIDGQ